MGKQHVVRTKQPKTPKGQIRHLGGKKGYVEKEDASGARHSRKVPALLPTEKRR